MEHLYTQENLEYRKANINIRHIGHNPKKSFLYTRLKNKTKREYYTRRSNILPPAIFTNYFDNYDNHLTILLYNNSFFLCGICLNVYNIGDKYNIDCGHYICNHCLILMSNNHIYKCPYCRITLINHDRTINTTNNPLYSNNEPVAITHNNNQIELQRLPQTTIKNHLHIIFMFLVVLFLGVLLLRYKI